MKALAAFYRLARRPQGQVVAVFMLWMAALPIFSVLNSTPSAGAAWGTGRATPAMIAALWRETVFLPFVFGVIVSMMTGELLATLFAWSLPSLRRRLVAGTMQVMSVVLVLTVIVHHWLSGNPVAAVGIAGCAFSAGLMVLDSTYSERVRWAVVLVLLAAFARPATLAAIASASPFAIGLATLAIGTWIALRGLLPAVQREQALAPFIRDYEPAGGERTVFGPWNGTGNHRPNTTAGWLAAMSDARPGGRMGWLKGQVLTALFVSAWCFTYNDIRFLVLMLLPMAGAASRLGALVGPSLYPLSRRRRATLGYLANFASAALSLPVVGVAAVMLFRWKPWPQFLAHAGGPPTQPVVPWVVITLALMPLAQWLPSQPPILNVATYVARRSRLLPRLVAVYVAIVGLALLSNKLYESQVSRVESVALAGEAVLAIIVTQSIFYLALRRSYARKDLV